MFKEAGLVEKYGSGISRILKEVHNHGNCSVKFEQRQHGFMVILSKIDSKASRVVENVVENVLGLVKSNKKISAKEIAEKLQVTERTAQRYLKTLQEKMRIKRVGPDKGGKWEVW